MRRVCTTIAIVWILSAIISIPPLIGWNDWPEEFNEETPCKLSEEKSYLVYSSSGSFFIPLFIMTVVYYKIFKATRRRLKDRAKASAMANLGRSAPTMTTVSTPIMITSTNHKDHITKSSSNDDSSSSDSPKVAHSFGNFKSRCVRCCQTSKTQEIHRGKGSKVTKAFHRTKSSHSNKDARIEIESASDDIELSRNEISSSNAFALTSVAGMNGQPGPLAEANNGVGLTVVESSALLGGGVALDEEPPNSTMQPFVPLNGDCMQTATTLSNSSNGTSAVTATSITIASSASASYQVAYPCTCNNERSSPIKTVANIDCIDSNPSNDITKVGNVRECIFLQLHCISAIMIRQLFNITI